MHVLAFDPYVGVRALPRARRRAAPRRATTSTRRPTSSPSTCPKTPETRGWLDAEAFAQMRDGVRIINCARGELIDDDALKDALDSGKVAGAALDVFQTEPITEHPLFGYPNVVVTPHLGASTTEAQDRAGVQTAEQVVAALTGGVVSTAVNIPAVSAEDMEVLGPFLPLCRRLGRLGAALARAARGRARRGRVPRAASPSATPACSRSPRSTACSPATPRRTSTSSTPGARRGARHRGRPSARRPSRATSPTSCASRCARPSSDDARRGHDARAATTARTCSRPGASASTSRWTTTATWRCFATATSRA